MRPIPWLTVVPLAALALAFALGLVAFAWRAVRRGRPRTARVAQQGESVLLGAVVEEYGVWFMSAPVRLLTRWRVHPDVLTWLGLALTLAAAVALGAGHFGLGGWLFLCGAMLDSMDGTVARNLGVAGPAGGFLDSVLDRVSDMAIFVGLIVYYRHLPGAVVLVAVALAAATLIPYVRAKAETLGLDPRRVILRRPERVVYLGAGLTLSPILAAVVEPAATRPCYHLAVLAVALIAVLGTAGVVRTSLEVRRQLRARAGAAPA